MELADLVNFLESQGYPIEYSLRLWRCKSLEAISVNNFLSVMSFLLNFNLKIGRGKAVFPTPFNRSHRLTIPPTERNQILLGIESWQLNIGFNPPIPRSGLESELKRCAIQRAKLLVATLKYLLKYMVTPSPNMPEVVPDAYRERRNSMQIRGCRRCISFEDISSEKSTLTCSSTTEPEICWF